MTLKSLRPIPKPPYTLNPVAGECVDWSAIRLRVSDRTLGKQLLSNVLKAGRRVYWQIVFTLPHESHPLIRLNLKFFYKLLFRCAADTLLKTIEIHFGCRPGLIMVLHSWGQQVGFHVHVHIILTGECYRVFVGGCVGAGVVVPAIIVLVGHRQHLASQQRFGPLQLATPQGLFQSPQKQAFEDHRQSGGLSLDKDPDQQRWIEIPLSPKKKQPLRSLTADELDLLRVLGSKHWVTNADPTRHEDSLGEDGKPRRGAEGIVNYLAAYVAGTAIGNGRLLDDNGRYVTYSYKDYRTDQIETRTCSGGEFVERLSLHIMPSGMQRVRYRGLFAAPGRERTLKRCRELIATSAADAHSETAEASSMSASMPVDDALLEDSSTKTACTCRHCQGQLQVLGRLKGNETLHAKSLAAAVISLLPVIAMADIQNFVQQLCSGVLHLWQLAEPLQEVIPRQYDFTPMELFALAGLLHATSRPMMPQSTAQAPSSAAFHRQSKEWRESYAELIRNCHFTAAQRCVQACCDRCMYRSEK